MRWLLVLVMASLGVRQLAAAVLLDQTIRYVNDQVITLGDVLERNQMRLAQGGRQPGDLQERIAFSKQSLEELTEEELLIQYAKQFAEERKIGLFDHEAITQKVMERARTSGRNLTLREQALQRRVIERRQTIDFILAYFDTRSPNITPADLWRDYQSRAKDFYRPPRAKVLEILLRPSGQAERQEVRQAKLKVFKRAQEAADAAVKQAVESRLDAYLAAVPDEQERLLGEVVKDIAALDGRDGLDPGSVKLVQDAKAALAAQAALRDPDQAMAQLTALRAQLAGKDADAFAKAARTVSQGPSASEGGNRGWIEPGSEGQAFDEVVFALKAGELSPVFRTEQGARLVLVTERIEARSREFAEVAGEIESGLRPKHQEEIRRQAVAMLRGKASIKDVATLDRLAE
jgi:parvulin-like peptidyl-prolyl isomerase